MTWLLTAWGWLKRNAVAVLAVIVAVLTASFLIDRERRKRLDAEAQAAVAKASVEIAELQARKKALVERADAQEPEVQEIDRRLAANKKAIVAAHQEVANMSGEEIEDAFRRLGY